MTFEQLCRNARYYPFTPTNKARLSAYLGLSVRQVERYISGASLHPCVIRLLEVSARGIADLEQWQGFRIEQNRLVNKNGEYWLLNDLSSRSLWLQNRRLQDFSN